MFEERLEYISLPPITLDPWVSESFDALNHHCNSCKYECFWPRNREGMGREEGRSGMHASAYLHLQIKYAYYVL